MSKDWRTILRFATLGLAITAFFLVFDRIDFFSKSWIEIWIFWASLVICPGLFGLALLEGGGELPMSDSGLVWFVVGLVNFAFYAVVRGAFLAWRKKPDESATS